MLKGLFGDGSLNDLLFPGGQPGGKDFASDAKALLDNLNEDGTFGSERSDEDEDHR
jgi:hypothetical protein